MSPLAGAALFAVLLVALVVGFLLVMTFNSVIALRTRIDKAWGNVEVALKQAMTSSRSSSPPSGT